VIIRWYDTAVDINPSREGCRAIADHKQ